MCPHPELTTALPTTKATTGDDTFVNQGDAGQRIGMGDAAEGSAQAACLFASCEREATPCLDDAMCFQQTLDFLYDPATAEKADHESPLLAPVTVCMEQHCPRAVVNGTGMASAGGDSSTSEEDAFTAGPAMLLVGGVILLVAALLVAAAGTLALRRQRSSRRDLLDLEEHFSTGEGSGNGDKLVWDDSDVGPPTASMSSLQYDNCDARLYSQTLRRQPRTRARASAQVRFADPTFSALSSHTQTQSQSQDQAHEFQVNSRQQRFAEGCGEHADAVTHFGILGLEPSEGTADHDDSLGPRMFGTAPTMPASLSRRTSLHSEGKCDYEAIGRAGDGEALPRTSCLKVRFSDDEGSGYDGRLNSKQSSFGVHQIVIDHEYDSIGSDL